MPAYAHPHARVIHPVEPPRALLRGLSPRQRADAYRAHAEVWHELRTGFLGSSDASTIAGHNPHSSLPDLYASKVHGHRPTAGPSAELGHDLEPGMRRRFTDQTGVHLRRVGTLANKEHPWMGCNPDALTSDGAGLELKTTTEQRHGWEWDAYPSDHATCQAQWSMLVTGATHWWVAVIFRDTGRFLVYRVERDEVVISHLFARASTFWHAHVLALVPPPTDASKATAAAQAHMYRRPRPGRVEGGQAAAVEARRLQRLNERIAELEAERDDVHARIKGMLGDQGTELTAFGVPVARWRSNGNFAHAQWSKAHPEEAERYMVPGRVLDRKAALAASPTAPDFIGRRFTTLTPTGKDAQILGLEPPVETLADVA